MYRYVYLGIYYIDQMKESIIRIKEQAMHGMNMHRPIQVEKFKRYLYVST